jgi:hypothetical protein
MNKVQLRLIPGILKRINSNFVGNIVNSAL